MVQAPSGRTLPALVIERATSPGASKIGGRPTLAARYEWPAWRDKPLAFLAQIDCAVASAAGAPSWLPAKGMLFFFYHPEQETWGFDPADRGSWRVIYDVQGPVADVTTPAPEVPVFPEIDIAFRAAQSVSDPQRMQDGTGAVSDEIFDMVETARQAIFGEAPRHQIGGFPIPVQNDSMELECELVSHGIYCGDSTGYRSAEARALRSAGGAAQWRLLLQLDTDDDADMMWGDCGMLYFWVREADARAGDFSNVWMILQCG